MLATSQRVMVSRDLDAVCRVVAVLLLAVVEEDWDVDVEMMSCRAVLRELWKSRNPTAMASASAAEGCA